MHAFDLPLEVFVLILNNLESRDLLRCATVCSQWRDAALDVKWKEHKVELVDLLGVLGPMTRKYRKIFGFTTRHSSVQDAVASGGWRRLDELRKKITRLRIEMRLTLEDINYVKDLQHAVESSHHAFCPRLRQLEVNLDGQPHPYPYDFIAGESLAQIHLRGGSTGFIQQAGSVASALEKVALRSPMIEHLDASRSNISFINYGGFSKLRTLKHGGQFSVTSWIQLCAGCPLLEVVTIWWMQDELPDEEAIHSGPEVQALPALRVLSIEPTDDGLFTSYVLRTTNMPELRELEVDLAPLGYSEGAALFSLVRSRSPLLEKLKLVGHRLEWGGLASFRELRTLELFGLQSSFTTEQVGRIIGNVPNLTRLLISSFDEEIDRTEPSFTPAFLETIAKGCHQISELEIPLNTLSVPWTSETQSPAAEFKRLKALALEPLHIEPTVMETFARYLARLCPTVRSFATTTLHPNAVPRFPGQITEEERLDSGVMQDLLFAVREDGVSDSAAQELE
ncbi:hypothetical protein FRC05_010004 [Tulasnella sp. 425]|nr:hypothetical protein FRC05_010004 [Tulasnella sp. 425]